MMSWGPSRSITCLWRVRAHTCIYVRMRVYSSDECTCTCACARVHVAWCTCTPSAACPCVHVRTWRTDHGCGACAVGSACAVGKVRCQLLAPSDPNCSRRIRETRRVSSRAHAALVPSAAAAASERHARSIAAAPDGTAAASTSCARSTAAAPDGTAAAAPTWRVPNQDGTAAASTWRAHVCVHVRAHARVHMHVYVCMYVRMCVRMCTCVHYTCATRYSSHGWGGRDSI